MPGRNHIQCLQRWNKVLKPGIKKGAWSEDEDAMSVNEDDDQDAVMSEVQAPPPNQPVARPRRRGLLHGA